MKLLINITKKHSQDFTTNSSPLLIIENQDKKNSSDYFHFKLDVINQIELRK